MTVLSHVAPAAGLLTLMAGVAGAICWHKARYHLRVVDPGRLYRSGALGRMGLEWIWRRFGIRTIVNLTSEEETRRGTRYEREKQFCRERGIELVQLAMEPGSVPDAEQIRRFLEVSLNERSLPVLVHCKQGVARTNMMVAVYLKERFGTPNEEILRRLPSFGHSFGKSRYKDMRKFVLDYKATGMENKSGDPDQEPRAEMTTVPS
jgi:tyrosine-protein phosphatase SIW14